MLHLYHSERKSKVDIFLNIFQIYDWLRLVCNIKPCSLPLTLSIRKSLSNFPYFLKFLSKQINPAFSKVYFLYSSHYLTTILTSLLGTAIIFTTSLPSISAFTLSFERAISCNASRERSLATMSLARTLPLI